MKKKHPIARAVIIVVSVILILFFAALIVCTILVTTDNNHDKYTLTETDDTLTTTALKASITGSEFTASEAMINTYLNEQFCTADNEEGVLKNLRVYFHQNEDTEIYARIKYMGLFFSLYAKVSMKLDSENGIGQVTFHDAKLGELPIPEFILNSILDSSLKDSPYVTFKDGTLEIQTRFTYDFDACHFTLNIEKFQPEDGQVLCKTNNLSWELLMAIKDYALDKGKQFFDSLFS